MTAYSDREIVDVFIETVDELGSSKYLRTARQGGVGSAVIMSPAINGAMLARSDADRDEVKAAILTIRFFCQDNEPTSLRRFVQLAMRLPLGQDEKDKIAKARKEFNDHLSKPPFLAFPPTTGIATNDDIFQTFLYGEFAHAHPDKRRLLKQWQSLPHYSAIKSQFDATVLQLIAVLAQVRLVLVKAIEGGRL